MFTFARINNSHKANLQESIKNRRPYPIGPSKTKHRVLANNSAR